MLVLQSPDCRGLCCNLLYIFGNLQSLPFWTREVKSVAAFLVHDILSGMYLGLLHKIENVCKHSKVTVGEQDVCKYSKTSKMTALKVTDLAK